MKNPPKIVQMHSRAKRFSLVAGDSQKLDDVAEYFRLDACPIIMRLKLTGVAPASQPGVPAIHHHPATCAVFSILFLKIDCMRSDAR